VLLGVAFVMIVLGALPRQKALRANSANLKVFEAQRADIEARNARAKEAAGQSGEKLDGTSYILIRQAGESGQLYGSVSGRDVSDAVNAEGGKIERAMVVLDKPIKTLGLHDVKVRLHSEVTVTVTLNIARSQDEAERQARGENVINSQFEEDRAADEQAAADMLEGGAGTHVDFERSDG
jgi:large subunit ribosomal protein L9